MKIENELVSVIIPIYNVDKYLAACIESVQKQTYQNLEMILIDDGSTDGSGKICDEYEKTDNRITVIHQENHGISQVRNRGVKEARGTYIFWIDSDDYVSESIVEELYHNLIEQNAEMSICNYTQGSERTYTFVHQEEERLEVFDAREGLERIYKNHHYSFIMAASWAKLIKKSLYE